MHEFYVYIMTNINHTVLYTGVTNDLYRRVEQHRAGEGGRFTSRYYLKKLVYYKVVGWIANPPKLLSSFWIVKPPPSEVPRDDDSLIPDRLIPNP